MRRTSGLAILVLLLGSFVVTPFAGAVCEMKTDYTPGVGCALSTVVVNNDAELDAYLVDFGFNGNKYQNLKLSYNVTRPNIDIHSPCKISLKDNVILSGDSICLDGRNGVIDDNGYTANAAQVSVLSELGDAHFGQGSVINANELSIKGLKKAKIGLNSQVNVNGPVRVVSTGELTSSDAIIKQGATINANSLLVQASRGATIGISADVNVIGSVSVISTGDYSGSKAIIKQNAAVNANSLLVQASRGATIGISANVNVSGNLSVISTGSYTGSLALVKEGAVVSAGNLGMISGNKATLQRNTVITATGDFTMQAASPGKCSIHDTAIISAGSALGNCLQPLSVAITTPADGWVTNSAAITVSGTVTDLNAAVAVNGISATVADASFNAGGVGLIEGANTITASATTTSGSASYSITVTLDTIAPAVSISSPADASTVDSNIPLITIDYSDTGSGIDTTSFQASINGTDHTSSFTVTATQATYQPSQALPEGANQVSASISDLAGNSSSAISSFTVSTATEPPITETSGFIHGQVFDAQTKLPLEGAVVTVAGIAGEALSDTEGKFVFPTPGTGTYKLKVTKPGYNYNQRLVDVVTTRQAAVAPAYLLPIDVTAHVAAAVGGVVTNTSGSLIVEIPAGALPDDTDISITLIEQQEDLPSQLPGGLGFVNFFYGEPSIQFNTPVRVRFQNRLGFPSGGAIPILFWNRQNLVWEYRDYAYVSEDGLWIEGDWTSFSSGGMVTINTCRANPTCPSFECADGASQVYSFKKDSANQCAGNPSAPTCSSQPPNCSTCPLSNQNASSISYHSGILKVEHELPSFRVLGNSESLELVYNSNTAFPSAVVAASIRPNDPLYELPADSVTYQISVGDTFYRAKFDSSPQESVFAYKASLYTLEGGVKQWFPSGSYPLQMSISNDYLRNETAITRYNVRTGAFIETVTFVIEDQPVSYRSIIKGRLAVNNQLESPFGAGWNLAGMLRLYKDPIDPQSPDESVVIAHGNGRVDIYLAPQATPAPRAFSSPEGNFSTLTENLDGSYTLVSKSGVSYNFDSNGFMISKTDRNGQTTSYAYTAGRLSSITYPTGGVVQFNYDANGRISSIVDAAGRLSQFTVDASGNLSQIINPDGSAVAYSYNADHLLTHKQDGRGYITQYVYDANGRIQQTIQPTGAAEQYSPGLLNVLNTQPSATPGIYQPAAYQQTVDEYTDGLGNTTVMKIGSQGGLIQKIDPLGNVTTYESNCPCGAPTKITYPNGRVVSMTYDAKGNLLTQTEEATGATASYTYEPNFNQVASITDPLGNVTQMTYDTNGRLIQITDLLGEITTIGYNSRGQLTSITNALNETSLFSYDPASANLLSTTDPLGNTTSYTYDTAGNLLSSTDAEGRTSSYTYDAMNRLLTITDTAGGVSSYEYDAAGNLVKLTDAQGQITQFAYNEINQPLRVTNPLGYTKTYAYDANRNLASTTDAEGQTISYAYDALSRLIQKTLPDNSSVSYKYDQMGNLLNIYTPRTLTIMEYDPLSRLKSSTSLVNTRLDEYADYVSLPGNTVIGSNDTSYDNTDILVVDGAVVTINGTHTFKNVAIINGGRLTHSAGSRLEITADAIAIDSTSSIDASGLGYAALHTLGNTTAGGSINHAGGSYGGQGGLSTVGGSVSNDVYGDYGDPNELGSGGGATAAGNGGGLVRITASSITLNGSIRADGQTVRDGGGSGGGIRLDADILSGSGTISANGGDATYYKFGGGGGGRIAIYYTDKSGFSGSIQAYGGQGTNPDAPTTSSRYAGAGTIYQKSSTQEHGDLIVDNNGNWSYSTPLRAIGAGVSDSIIYSPATNISILSNANAVWPIPDPTTGALGLVGLELNPNTIYTQTYPVVDNTATTITVDGDLTLVAAAGDSYVGEYTFDNLYIRGQAKLSTADDIYILGSIAIDNASLKANALKLSASNQLQSTNATIEVTEPLFDGHPVVTLDGDTLTLNNIGNIDSLQLINGSTLMPPSRIPLEISVGTLTVDSSSSIDAVGKGYAGGYTLGNTSQGAGYSPAGGSYGGKGNLASNAVYGDYRDPAELGSGGHLSVAGSGGGLLRIVANSLILNGAIHADGETVRDGGGSGGGIRLDVGTLSGSGTISANGGSTTYYKFGGGGGGRIAIYYTDKSGFSGSIQAYGGYGYDPYYAGAGTIYLKSSTQGYGDLIVDNGGYSTPGYSTPLRAISAGVSDSIIYSPTTNISILSNANAVWPIPDPTTGALGLVGLELNPNTIYTQIYPIVDNTATTITVAGDLTLVAAAGDSYVGEYHFNSLSVINGAQVSTNDDVYFNSLNTTGGILNAHNIYQSGKADSHIFLVKSPIWEPGSKPISGFDIPRLRAAMMQLQPSLPAINEQRIVGKLSLKIQYSNWLRPR